MERFRVHNTGKIRCGVTNHQLNVFTEYLQVQLIEEVVAREVEDFMGKRKNTSKHHSLL